MPADHNIHVSDKMQTDYIYALTAPEGRQFDSAFAPFHTPAQMLEFGVFEGKYINDCRDEYPQSWFAHAKLSEIADPSINYFGIKSRQPLSVWQQNGWIYGPDPRGWFQWYCRYYLGRRLPEVDARQISRWKGFARHAGQIRANCQPHELLCRPRQRQALLQWAHDPFI